MNNYKSFLELTGTYLDLLLITETMELYKSLLEKEEDFEVCKNIEKNLAEYDKRKQEILHSNNINNIKEYIMSMWDPISINLLKNREQIEHLYTPKYYKYPIPLYVIMQLIVKKDIEFFDIYHFLIQNNLYNPNKSGCGTSEEPFFSMLPIEPLDIFYKINMQVINNSTTDFHILRNGTDIIQYALLKQTESQDERLKEYWQDYIINAVKGSCSLLDAKRYRGILNYENKPNIFDIINRVDLTELNNYLLSEQGVENQIRNALYPSKERDYAINFYLEHLPNRKINKKLELLKTK